MRENKGFSPTIALCLITRDDPALEDLLASVSDYVDEINIVITSATDTISQPIADKYGAKTLIFTDCNDENDKIIDFSLARNKSLSMISPSISFGVWFDSDDAVINAENILKLTETIPPTSCAYLFPYEYSYHPNGSVNTRHYRERLFSPPHLWHFVGAIHEVMVPKDGSRPNQMIKTDDVIVSHRRQFSDKPTDTTRNLRILQKQIELTPDDPRTQYYLGLELSNNGQQEKAKHYLSTYLSTSGWDDERALAAYKLADMASDKGETKEALHWSAVGLAIKPNWFESYYYLCRSLYFLSNWQASADLGKIAIQKPPTDTLLFINENHRFDIHTYLNVSLNHIGDVRAALQSVEEGLKGDPTNHFLICNRKIYRQQLGLSGMPLPKPKTDPSHLDIIFISGPALEVWSPETLKTVVPGGSELMLYHQAKNLTALGHKVRVFAMAEGTYDGVEYIHHSKFQDLSADILIVSRLAPYLSPEHNISCHLKLLWCHDTTAIGATAPLLQEADYLLALSEWHKDNLISQHNLHPNRIILTRNGIDLSRFSRKVKRNKHQAINSSSPDRSWPSLLDCWARIVKEIPDATLILGYSFHNWKKMATNDKLQLELIERLEKQVAETPGIIYRGRMNQEELAEAYLSSNCWLYPQWFQETNCISAAEAQAAGCYAITSPIAAVPETLSGYDKTSFIDGDWVSREYQDRFVSETVRIMTHNTNNKKAGKRFDIYKLAKEWEEMLQELLVRKSIHPIADYRPSLAYQGPKQERYTTDL